MENKHTNYLIWIVLFILLGGIVFLIAEPIIHWTEKSEMRLYIRIFLIMFAVNTFATLRLYNSIVQNTRFSIKLREAFGKLLTAIPGLERSLRALTSSVGSLKSTTESLDKTASASTEKIEGFIDKLHKQKTKTN